MKILRILGAATILMGLTITFARTAKAADTHFNGAICNPDWGSTTFIAYNQYGAFNDASNLSARARVTCPFTLTNAPNVSRVGIIVYDRFGPVTGGGTNDNLACWVVGVDFIGNTRFHSATLASTGNKGDHQELVVAPNTNASSWVVVCDIPPGRASYVTTISVRSP
jgi:hypothetical protein